MERMRNLGTDHAALTGLLQEAAALGFDKFIYAVEAHYGEMTPPLEVMGSGWRADFLDLWLSRLSDDPIRRMVARGDIPLSHLPIVFENSGVGLSLPGRYKLSATEVSLLTWCYSQGVRSGVSMGIRMTRGRYASINFYGVGGGEHQWVVDRLFMLGHRVHAHLEPSVSQTCGGGRLLSRREVECLEWIARGKCNGEIALLLGISLDTVKEHIQSLYQKLAVHGRAQAVARGYALAYLD
jgi:DNA-binding CsgD family transcriptional regulator